LLAGSAGLLGNLMICCLCSLIVAFLPAYGSLAYMMLILNAYLIVFNCLPLPALDGFAILKAFCPLSEKVVQFFEYWGFIVLLVLIHIPWVRHGLSFLVQLILTVFIQLGLKMQIGVG
jgi:Zn-dependent protease